MTALTPEELDALDKAAREHGYIKPGEGRWITSAAGRRYIYAILAALLGLAAGFGLVDAAASQAIDVLILAVLNLTGSASSLLAAVNTRPEH